MSYFNLLNGVRNKITVSKNMDLIIQFNSGVPNEKLQESNTLYWPLFKEGIMLYTCLKQKNLLRLEVIKTQLPS